MLGTPQRGIEFGGYPNNGNFTWSVAFVDGTNSAYGLGPSLTARNTKDVYVRVSQRFNLERDPESRNAVQAAGPTGPRDHTSIRFGAFYYHGKNQLNYGGSQFSFLGTINEPFYRAGGDVRFKYRKMELFGVGLVGHDNNHSVDTVAQTITNAPAVTYTGGFAGSNFWIYPWMIAYMRYDFVNSPTDLCERRFSVPDAQPLQPRLPVARSRKYQGHRRISVSLGSSPTPIQHKQYVVFPAELVRRRHRLRF